MKVEVVKYLPNFVEGHRESVILEFNTDDREWIYVHGTNAKNYILQNVSFLKDKIGKVSFEHCTLTQTLIVYEDRPYAFINLLEI